MRAKLLFAGLVTGLVVAVGVQSDAQMQTAGPAERKLELKFDGNGYVTLIAQNVSVNDVFLEWARVGKSKVVNADKLPGGQISVQFDSTPELKLVEALIRLSKAQGAGYIVAPRRIDGPVIPSRFEVIDIMPRSNPQNTFVATSQAAPLYPQTPDDELPPVMPPTGPGPASQQPPQVRPPTSGGPGVVPVGPGAPSPLPGTTGRGRGPY